MRKRTRFAIFGAAGVLSGIVLGILLVLVLTRTQFGMERARLYAVNWLAEEVNGQIRIGRITGAGLLSGITLHNFEIIGPNKRQFIYADSATLAYDWRTLIGGEIKLDRIELHQPRAMLELLPGDTAWNYEQIFKPKRPKIGSGRRRLIMFEDVQVNNAFVVLRQPFEEDASPISDTARMNIEQVPGGRVKVMRFDQVTARLDRVIWESPIEHGRLFRIRSLRGRGFVWKDPVNITRLEGTVTTRDSIVGLDFARLEFGSSRVAIQGKVIQVEGGNFLDLVIDGSRVDFKDLLWAYPKLPREGNASATVRIQTQKPKGVLFYASNARIVAPGTRMSGNVGLVMGDTLYFTDVDLRAAPLNLELIESVLPGKLPVQGLLVGTVEVKGPLSSLDIKGDLELTQPNAHSPSSVRWSGRFDTRDFAATGLKADLTNLDLALINAFRPELKLKGVVNGRVEADGVFADRFSFAAALQHELAGLSSHVEGKGTYDNKSRQLDLRMNALPLSLEEVASVYPALARFKGEARGPINLTGPIDDLKVDAKLQTRGGQLDFDGALQLIGGRRRYAGSGRMSGFQLDRLLNDLPETNISGKLQFDVTATSAADAKGSVSFDFANARVAGVPLRDVNVRSRIDNGVAAVDSAYAETAVGRLNATGTLSLVPAQSGELVFALRTDSIVPWGAPSANTGGRLDARATLTSKGGAFDLSGRALLQRAFWGRAYAGRARVEVTGKALGTDSSDLRVQVATDTASVYGEALDSARIALAMRGPIGQLTFAAGSTDRTYNVSSDVRRDSALSLRITELLAGPAEAPWQLRSPFALTVHSFGVQVDSFALQQLDSRSTVNGSGNLAWTRSRGDSVAAAAQPLTFKLAFEQVPIGEYLRFVRAKPTATGLSSGTIQLAGTAGEPIIQAEALVTDLRYAGTRLGRLLGSFAYADHEVNARIEAEHENRRVVEGNGRIPVDLGFVPLDRRKLNRPLEFAIRADSMPAALITGLFPGFQDVEGSVAGNLILRGTTVDPTMAGLLTLRNGVATYLPAGVRYRDANALFRVLNDSIVDVEGALRGGEGKALLRGGINFATLSDPKFDSLTIDATSFLAAKRRDAEFTTTGRIFLNGRYTAPVLTGSIEVDRGALYLDELYRQYQIVELDRALLFDVIDTTVVSIKRVIPEPKSPFLKNLRVRDLVLDVGRESWLRSRNLNVQVIGQLELNFDRAAEDLRLTGELTALRGTYQMEYRPFTRRFDIRSGTVAFPGTPGMDPNLDFRTVYRAKPLHGEPIDIYALVAGTLRNPRIRLTSDDDQLSESDLASYLFFGAPTNALSTTQSRTVDAFNGRFGAVGALGFNAFTSSGLGYLAGGLQSFGQDLGLFDYVSLTAAESLPGTTPQQNPFNSLLATTQLEIGRYFPPNFYVIGSKRLVGASSQFGFRVEWRFHPTYTLELFGEDRFARSPTLGIEQTTSFRKLYGFFLFREWGY